MIVQFPLSRQVFSDVFLHFLPYGFYVRHFSYYRVHFFAQSFDAQNASPSKYAHFTILHCPNVLDSLCDDSVLFEQNSPSSMKQYSLISYVKEKIVIKAFNLAALKHYRFSGVKEVCKNQTALLPLC
jgi:hypothetical protein